MSDESGLSPTEDVAAAEAAATAAADADVDNSAGATSAAAAIAEADASIARIKADAAALDAAFPELRGFSDDDSLRRKDVADAEAAALFQKRAEEEQLTAMKEELADDAADAEAGTHTALDTPSRGTDVTSDPASGPASDSSSKALIDLLTRRDPPPPPEQRAAGGFPLIVIGATSQVSDEATRLAGWELTWHDEFDGDSLRADKWTPRANASAPGLEYAGGQQQWYDPRECHVAGGALALRTRRTGQSGDFFSVPGAKRASASEYPFVSCWVDTERTFTQTYGRVEIRAKLPDHGCPGVWPQHWMLPHPDTSVPRRACWPLGGEIDIMQSFGRGRGGPGARAGTVESGYHFAPKGECGVDGLARQQFPAELGERADFHTDFHVYAVEWDKESLTYFVDGVVTMELSSFHVPIIPRWPFYLILNTAVSPFGLPEALECDYDLYHYVDYVRVYRRQVKEVHSEVWWFLSLAVGGLLLALGLAACVVMRQAAVEALEEEGEEGRLSVSGGAGEFGGSGGDGGGGSLKEGGWEDETYANNEAGKRRGGPRRENLRLFDNVGARRGGGDGGGGLITRRGGGSGGRNNVESAPLIGGVRLRLPGDGDGGVGSSRVGALGGSNSGQLRSRRLGPGASSPSMANTFGFDTKSSVFNRALGNSGDGGGGSGAPLSESDRLLSTSQPINGGDVGSGGAGGIETGPELGWDGNGGGDQDGTDDLLSLTSQLLGGDSHASERRVVTRFVTKGL